MGLRHPYKRPDVVMAQAYDPVLEVGGVERERSLGLVAVSLTKTPSASPILGNKRQND